MNEKNSCIAILQGTFKEGGQKTPEFAQYSQRSTANSVAHQAKLLGRYVISSNMGQGSTPHVIFVLEYPSREIAENCFKSPEYLAIIPLRDVAFEEVKILLS